MSEAKKKHPVLTAEETGAHPGWAIQFSDGTWLGGAHGWFRSDEAFYAERFATEEEAIQNINNAKRDEEDYYSLEYKVVLAWEPLVESLRVRIRSLKDVATITPNDIFDMTLSLESALYVLKKAQ